MQKQFFSFVLISILFFTGCCFALDGDKTTDVDRKDVYSFVEKMPEFPSGQDSLMKYLGRNIVYPVAAKEAGLMDTIYVSFVIIVSLAFVAEIFA